MEKPRRSERLIANSLPNRSKKTEKQLTNNLSKMKFMIKRLRLKSQQEERILPRGGRSLVSTIKEQKKWMTQQSTSLNTPSNSTRPKSKRRKSDTQLECLRKSHISLSKMLYTTRSRTMKNSKMCDWH